jgi:hypothetical protein
MACYNERYPLILKKEGPRSERFASMQAEEAGVESGLTSCRNRLVDDLITDKRLTDCQKRCSPLKAFARADVPHIHPETCHEDARYTHARPRRSRPRTSESQTAGGEQREWRGQADLERAVLLA